MLDRNDLVMEESTFMFEGILYQTLPYANRVLTITCVHLFEYGLERVFDVNQLKALMYYTTEKLVWSKI